MAHGQDLQAAAAMLPVARSDGREVEGAFALPPQLWHGARTGLTGGGGDAACGAKRRPRGGGRLRSPAAAVAWRTDRTYRRRRRCCLWREATAARWRAPSLSRRSCGMAHGQDLQAAAAMLPVARSD